MEELEALWEDSFDLCKTMVDACKAGEMKMNASLLKELQGFIRQSVEFLKYREAEQVFHEDHQDDEDEALEKLLNDVSADLEDDPLDVPDEYSTD
jgi:hypothetical protein